MDRSHSLPEFSTTRERTPKNSFRNARVEGLSNRSGFHHRSGPEESRAWTIRDGWLAPAAAGVIHGDFERGFIRAETVAYDALVEAGNEKAAKEAGLMRSEGKDYRVKDGDVMLFRFNV